MHIKIQIKSKEADGWHLAKVAEINGTSLRDALAGFIGKMVITEVDADGEKFYCCGQESLRIMMSTRGQAVLNQAASTLLDRINPAILDIKLSCNPVGQIFENSQLEAVTADIPDYEEQQPTLFQEDQQHGAT